MRYLLVLENQPHVYSSVCIFTKLYHQQENTKTEQLGESHETL